jgi:hypothetical protein
MPYRISRTGFHELTSKASDRNMALNISLTVLKHLLLLSILSILVAVLVGIFLDVPL